MSTSILRRLAALLAALAAGLALPATAAAVSPLPTTLGGVHGYTGLQGHSDHHFTAAELRIIARQSDIVVGLPNQIHSYGHTLRLYHAGIRFYVYQNGMFGQAQNCSAFPASWKLHDKAGHTIYSRSFHNCLMNPFSGWTAHVLAECRAGLKIAPTARGCFLDQMSAVGDSGFVSAPPVDPRTGKVFSVRGYLGAVAHVGNTVAKVMPVIGNSYESGRKYFNAPTAALDTSLMGVFEAEHWLGSNQPGDLETPSVWKASVEMLILAQRHGKKVMANFGDLDTQLARWQAFNVASMMLGNNGHVWLHFDSSNKAGPNSWQLDSPILHMRIGRPVQTYARVASYFAGRNYVRRYTHGVVIVNPSAHTYTVALGGTYITPAGSHVTHVTMGPYSGTVLRH